MKQTSKKTQLQRINEQLVALAPNVSTEDRKAIGLSEVMVIAYLKGRGKDLDTAMKVLRIIRGRIREREKEIAGTEEKRA